MQHAFAKWSDEAMRMRGCDRTARAFFAVEIARNDDQPAARHDAIPPPPPDDPSYAEQEPAGPQTRAYAEADEVEADLTRDARYETIEPDDSIITPLIAASVLL